MKVRCPHCGAEYDAPISEGALGVVDRCAECGRTGLQAVWADAAEQRPAVGRRADAPDDGDW